MSSRRAEFAPETEILLITFTDQENLRKYLQSNEINFPISTDTSRNVYRSFGLERGRAWRVYGPKAIYRYWQIMRKNGFRRLKQTSEDTLQLGGDFVIDPAGNLSWGFWGQGPDDRPTVDDLLRAAQTAFESSL